MHLGTKDYTQQLFSLLSTCWNLSASLGSFRIWLEYIRNLRKFMDYCWSPFSIASVPFSSEHNSSYHLYTCSPTLILFMSAYFILVQSLDFSSQWNVKQEAPWPHLSTCWFHLSPVSKHITGYPQLKKGPRCICIFKPLVSFFFSIINF